MAEIRVGVLGPVAVSGATVPVARQQRLILAALAAVAPSPRRSGDLIEGLWPNDRPVDARKALQVLVARLRRSLDPAELRITSDADGYRLDVEPLEVDARRFELLCAEERSLSGGDLAARARCLRAALALWRGEPFGDLGDEGLLDEAANALRLRREQTTDRLHEVRLQMGESDDLLPEVADWAQAHPLDERAWCRFALLLHRCGRPTEALRVLQTHRRAVRDVAGIEPTSKVAELEARLLTDDTTARPGGTIGNLTVPARSFLGRAADIQALAPLLAPGAVVSLVGAAGIGKTTLAVHLAAGVRNRYRDGVWVCELADIASSQSIVDVLATTLGVTQQRGLSLLHSVVAAFADAKALVVLDNCEHVRSSAREVISALCQGCPKITILATSREPVDHDAEQLYQLAPLAVPDAAAEANGNPAFELFVSRARESGATVGTDQLTTAAVIEICQRLDGLPLAIELAAARARVMSVIEMSARLDHRFQLLTRNRPDRPPRHQTLWDAVDWSYQLLGEHDRQLFNQLSVFQGGFSIQGAAAISGRQASEAEESVWSLVERSLLNIAPGGSQSRYQMLETLRQFGSEQLNRTGDLSSLRDAHLRHYVEFAEAAGEGVRGPDEAHHVRQIGNELANLRAAHQHAIATSQVDDAARLCVALHDYAEWRQFFELGTWATATLKLDVQPTGLAPTLHAIAGWSRNIAGDFQAAIDHAHQGLEAERRGGRECGWLHDVLAHCAYFQHNDHDGLELSRQEILRARRASDPGRLSYVLADSAIHAVLSGHHDLGAEQIDEALHLAETLRNPSLVSLAQLARGFLHRQHNPTQAIQWFQRAATLADTVESAWTASICRGELTLLLALNGDPVEAVDLGLSQFLRFRRAGDLSRAHSVLRLSIPAVHRLTDRQHWDDLVTLEAGTASRPMVNEPFNNDAIATVLTNIERDLGPQAIMDARTRGLAMNDDTLFELGLHLISLARGDRPGPHRDRRDSA